MCVYGRRQMKVKREGGVAGYHTNFWAVCEDRLAKKRPHVQAAFSLVRTIILNAGLDKKLRRTLECALNHILSW